MITILAVGQEAETLAAFGASHPSIEVVTAHGAEDALERLARNRRIDAVLLLDGSDARETARLIAEEDPGAPPVFASAGVGELAGARRLAAGSGVPLLEALLEALATDSPENEKGG
jgi:CheY-like chemotaxis protein